MAESGGSPLHLVDRETDLAISAGWERFVSLLESREPEMMARRIALRFSDDDQIEALPELIEAVVAAESVEDRAMATADLAEMVEPVDPELASVCWTGVLQAGHFSSDGELVFEGSLRLSELEEAQGDPLSAAEYLLAFLNWRREPGHSSDPDAVHDAFERLMSLAQEDGAQEFVGRMEHRQAQFAECVEAGDQSAETGDWLVQVPQFEAWA